MLWSGGDLEDLLVPIYLLWVGTHSPGRLLPLQPIFEQFQVQGIQFPEQFVPVPHHPDSLEFLPKI